TSVSGAGGDHGELYAGRGAFAHGHRCALALDRLKGIGIEPCAELDLVPGVDFVLARIHAGNGEIATRVGVGGAVEQADFTAFFFLGDQHHGDGDGGLLGSGGLNGGGGVRGVDRSEEHTSE